MAHRIEQPWDKVYSTVSREWHGLADVVERIDMNILKPVLFPIIEGDVFVQVDGESVRMQDKALVADYRHRDDLPEGERLKALSVMGKDYFVIDNTSIFGAVEKAINDHGLDAKIVTAGSVRGGKTFFMSLQQDDQSHEFKNGDKWDFYISFNSSHDGVDALVAYLCGFRSVCWNTIRWGCDSADTKIRIQHKKNAKLQMDSLPEIIVAMRNQQTEMIEALTHLAGIECDIVKAQRIVSGYFSKMLGGEKELSVRTSNSVRGIIDLFQTGQGNRGESMYDLTNGVTDYYTNGAGTGTNQKLGDRYFKANFGSAADHKERFTTLLFDKDSRDELEDIGAGVVLTEPKEA
jgi:hypothetical protein